ncbi:DNA-processing protein DprA [Pseudomonadales bacterium]|nr:DNA-processing protein DprA [Pseudomonadales bacterium]MDC1102595.1 DNA-processing protein DprA [Pseudomonadales bacterium]MDC1298752.1 DNA-processing protein DprA [Pseudomonadales bacterium]MDC3329173.1 DNA-processing protein DprA [Pseudomonadales bacterium]
MPLTSFLKPPTQQLNRNRFPRGLKEIPSPPSQLYCVGQLDICLGPKIAMVGSRAASWHGLQFAEALAGQLAALGFVVVSGLARGIDAASHRGALAVGGKTIAVLGQGCDLVYPKQNQALYQEVVREGLLVSEYPDGTGPKPYHFPARNRIITGLCDALIVVEARTRSGSLISAKSALAQGREVFAVPGPVVAGAASGCHELIREGAHLLDSITDLFREMPQLFQHVQPIQAALPTTDPPAGQVATNNHQDLLALLTAGPMVFSDLLANFDGTIECLVAALAHLEVSGQIEHLGTLYQLRMQAR